MLNKIKVVIISSNNRDLKGKISPKSAVDQYKLMSNTPHTSKQGSLGVKLRMMMGGLAALSLSMSAGVASAETWEARTFNDLVIDSTACVKGTVLSVEYETINGATYTITTFSVDDRAIGPVRRGNIRVRTEGGRVSTATIPVMEVGSSGVRFFTGQEAILFLQRTDTRRLFTPLNGGQGVYMINDGMVELPVTAGNALTSEAAIDFIADRRRSRAKNVAQ